MATKHNPLLRPATTPENGVSLPARLLRWGRAGLARDGSLVGFGLLAGLLGAVASLLVMGALRLWWGAPTPPELVGERLLPLMSADQFVALLIRFQPHPKTGPLSLALLGQTALGILLGPAYAFALRGRSALPDAARWLPGRRAWVVAGAFALGMELLALALFWPVLIIGVFGAPLATARLLTGVALLLTFAAYAAVTALAFQALRHAWAGWRLMARAAPAAATGAETDARIGRREALAVAGGAVAFLAVGAVATNQMIAAYLARSNLAYEGADVPPSVMSAITPNKDFYVVSKNVLDPTVIIDNWRLEVAGLTRQAKSWIYDEVLRLPSETRAITLECISNPVGGRLLSTAEWRGVSLATVLDLAGGVSAPAGKYVVFYGVDGYATSLPLADLLQARTLLAYQMNGASLPQRHGYPLRAVVPGRFGEQSAKWVTRIEITDHEVKGFYQSQGWSAAPLETVSRIDAPHGQASVGAIAVSGVAFAGIRGIRQVDVSADGGATWHAASLTPPLSDQTWTLWTWMWRPTAPGAYTLVARATDGTGAQQTATERGTVPNGATGRHMVKVMVK